MFRAGEASKRPLPGPAPPRVRSVEVARGRAGYGFTLSGQAPCVLSCVMRGSPADFVGLRAGDQILAVNEINVKKASHEDVVKLIGKCSGVLHMVIAEGASRLESCSSDEEGGLYEGKGWLKPKLDSKALGINRAERVVEEMQSGGIFNMIFENPSLCASSSEPLKLKQRSLSESAATRFDVGHEGLNNPNPNMLSKEEISKVIHDDSVFSIGLESQDDFALDAGILNVAMIVGYLGSIELPSTSSNLESDSLQAIRGCMRRLRAEQKIHSLVTMKIMHDCVQLSTDRAGVVAEYPAEKLAFSAVCPDDRRFFGLVTMQTNDDGSLAQEEEGALRTSCHVFMVDPDLFNHKIHQGIARRFGFECTADPDTNGCLEFPASSLPVLQFISVLYRDMGELIEGMRARAFLDGDADAHQNNSTSSNSDSGIGNFHQEEKSNRVLVVDLGGSSSRHGPGGSTWDGVGGRGAQPWGAPWTGPFCPDPEGSPPFEATHQTDRFRDLNKHLGPASPVEVPPASLRSSVPPSKRGTVGAGCGFNQRWLPVHVLREWQCGHASDQDSYTDSTDGWSSVNCGTLPPPMSKIPADRYRVEGSFAQPPLSAPKREWSRKAFGMQSIFGPHRNVRKTKEDKKGSKFGRGTGLTQPSQRTSARRSFGRSKRFSITRSLDDLESATVSDGELTGADLKDCVSNNSLSSNASLPSVQSCRRLRERRVASWAVSFERLLQDPVGVRYFSDFLRKEFSEENILFWQACEYFNHVPAHDKKELSYRAREIFSKFLCSKATTPVNIDSQAQLADDVLRAPHPDMFKEQQLQIFNLMKFDSYTRFLKSPLYQECILAEVEGRALPDSQQVPSSPASKHSLGSDHSSVSTPKKLSGKSKSGRSLNEEVGDEDSEKKRKGAFFSWSRTRSTGRSQKKREHGDHADDALHANGGLCRRESQGSVSSAGSLDLSEACRTLAPEKDKATKHCCIHLPDGTSCVVAVRAGFSIKDILSGLCERHGINGAAADLFLVGGDKPLVLHQDSSILESRDLRLEKRTLFRLDLVPINRSVGLKAKPTKPVTEVLRPVVAKYGLDLSGLLVRLSGEKEPLDLGAPISSLDGQRVVLEEKDPSRGKASTDKQKGVPVKQNIAVNSSSRNHSATGEERTLGKSNSIKIKGENGKNARDPRLSKREESIAKIGKKKYQKINLDEAEEFFELISKAQSNRADDQRGLLRKEDLVLPEFLRLPPGSTELTLPTSAAVAKGFSKRSATGNGRESASQPSEQWEPAQESSDSPSTSPGSAPSPPGPPGTTPPGQKSPSGPFCTAQSPVSLAQEGTAQIWKRQSQEVEAGGIQTVEDEHVAELTLMGEGDISSPNSSLLPPPSAPQDVPGPSRPGSGTHGSQGLPVNRIIDVDLVTDSAPGRDGGVAGARAGPGRSQASGGPPTSDLPGLSPVPGEPAKPKASAHHATFV
ncbi:regulator of G-protein signaling 12 isoform X1 [Hylobates moloch]|uniref:regulator of G-protein signaling 12 isoform X1 n=2 Tax=Hylobates moloch TaxID=81572 RepID=UPI0013627D49|nr:regulator of G-protein signaling 12 isoform X1 [Hylobates moloch]XP_058286156.1 regulator of G-protein signaling 12 isoform X1 [Hylobates moloch]XP_058286157.1 regulator of G-protein signaling 12 isoform X1 [Hylobates moloch]